MSAEPVTRLDKILTRVQGLLAQAANTPYAEEADTFRAKADELMATYAIHDWQVKRKSSSARPKAVKDNIDIGWYWQIDDTDVAQVIYGVMWEMAAHCRVEPAYLATDYTTKTMPVVGMDSDVQYFKLIFTDVFRQMLEAMDPHPRAGEPMIEALVRMKEAGMKWEDIFDRLKKYHYYPQDLEWSPSKMNYAGKYTDYCIKHRRPRVRTTPAVYRRSFTGAFKYGLAQKLRKMREEQGQNTGTMALALRDYREDVKQSLYDFFPEHKPKDVAAMMSGGAQSAKRIKAKKVPLRATSQEASQRGLLAGNNVSIIARGDDSRQRIAGELE